jgi:hypothetical protein
MTLLPASEKFLSKFPSSRYLSSSGSYPLDLSGVGDPAGSNATACLALRVTGTHKPLHHDKVAIPSGGGGGVAIPKGKRVFQITVILFVFIKDEYYLTALSSLNPTVVKIMC